jgi:hypothetical protein
MKSALISFAFFLAAASSAVAAGSGSNNTDSSNNVGSNIGNGVGNGMGNGGVGNGVGDGNLTISAPTATGASGGAPLGWNSFHALYCLHYIDASGNLWSYIFSKETPSKFFFSENISYWAAAFRSACSIGSLVAIYVTDSTSGTFDQVAVYGPGF